MKLLGNTESEITKDDSGEKVSHLEITEVVLVHCNIVNNNYQHDSRVLYTFIPNNLKNTLQQMHLKLLHKEWFKKKQKQLVIWLVIKLLTKLSIRVSKTSQ